MHTINNMVPFIFLAVVEILIGLFIYVVFAPEKPSKKYIYRYVLNLDPLLCNVERNKGTIKKANRITFIICISAALLILLNGLLTTRLDFIDMKEKILTVTIIAAFLFRYIYIMKKCRD